MALLMAFVWPARSEFHAQGTLAAPCHVKAAKAGVAERLLTSENSFEKSHLHRFSIS